ANLRIRRFHPRRIITQQKLYIDDIIIDTPSVHVINEYHAYNDTIAVERDSRTLYQRLSGMLGEVGVETFEMNDINFRFTKKTDSTLAESFLQHVKFKAEDIRIDSLSQYDTTRIYHTRAIQVDIPGFSYETADSLYTVSFDRLTVGTANKTIVLTGLRYIPTLDRAAFYRKMKMAKERAEISFPQIRMEDIDFRQFVRNQKIYAGSLHLDSGYVSISNDLRYPKKPKDKIGKSPHQLLLNMRQPLKIDSVL